MERDRNLTCKPGSNIDESFTLFSLSENSFALQSYRIKK